MLTSEYSSLKRPGTELAFRRYSLNTLAELHLKSRSEHQFEPLFLMAQQPHNTTLLVSCSAPLTPISHLGARRSFSSLFSIASPFSQSLQGRPPSVHVHARTHTAEEVIQPSCRQQSFIFTDLPACYTSNPQPTNGHGPHPDSTTSY